jgi:hypothetical protein
MKKKKNPKETTEPEIRMITPDPIPMENESGRLFEIQLGRFESISINRES